MATKDKAQTFDTQIVIESPNWKVRIYLGLAGLVVLVIIGFLYRIEAGVILLAVGLATAGRIAIVGYHRHRLAWYERRRLEAEAAKLEAEAIRAKAQSYFVETGSGTFQLEGIIVQRFYPSVTASKLLADIPPYAALPEPEAPRPRALLNVEFVHLLVVGPSGAGKTTALCHLIDNAPAGAKVIVLDPHSQFNAWPPRAEVIGQGRDWPAIDAALGELIRTMDKRYNGLEPITQPILIVCDEWLATRDKCSNAERFFTDVGSEARKVNMSLIVSSISATADDLATSAAIRDNLCQLSLTRTLKQQNRGELRWSRKDAELVELPGPYVPRYAPPAPAAPAPPAELDLIDFDAGPVAPSPDPMALKAFELYQQGKSLRAISQEIFGSVGGRQVSEVRAMLAEMGVSKSVSDSEGVS